MPRDSVFSSRIIGNAIKEFVRIRTLDLKKPPATAELIGWARILGVLEIDLGNLKPGQVESVIMSYSVLAKTKEDLELMQRQAPVAAKRQ